MNLVAIISRAWGWTGLQPVEVVAENDFGNLMVRDTSGQYWRICPEDLYCRIIASDRSALDRLIEASGDVALQTKDLPDGTKVHLRIIE